MDIKANGLWGSIFERTFFDVKVFNPYARTCPKTPKDAYAYHESIKKLKYEERITEIENSSFTPLIFATTGGCSKNTNKTIKQIARKLSVKKNERYSNVMNFLRTELSFALLRSTILCLRGCRALKEHAPVDNSIDAIVIESRID